MSKRIVIIGAGPAGLTAGLELLRQNSNFYENHFGDAGNQYFTPTIYLLGQNRLNKLMNFVKEEGLDTFSKYRVFPAVTQIALHQPSRRDTIVEWYREVIRFATKKLPDTQWFDNVLAGMILHDVIDLQASELLPDIKKMFDTGLVNLGS